MPEFYVIFAHQNNKIPEFYTIFARKMPEFCIIIARKIFTFFLGGGTFPCPISYAYGGNRARIISYSEDAVFTMKLRTMQF